MKVIGIRELKKRLSEVLRMVRYGEEVLVTDRGEVIAELRKPGRGPGEPAYPRLVQLAQKGWVRLGSPNRADLYPASPCISPDGEAARLLDEDREER